MVRRRIDADGRKHAGRGLALLALLALALAPTTAFAQNKTVPTSRVQVELSYAPLVKKVAPAVVNIYTKKVVRRPISPFMRDPFFRRFFGQRSGGGRRIVTALGSGVIVDPKGLIVTNYHVIKGAEKITVVLADRNEFSARIVQADKRSDLAVLRIKPRGYRLKALRFRDSDELEVGDIVLAIGNPFGVGQTVTSGIVSALARTVVGISDFRSFIQTDAAINPGNSGGALVTLDGRLVGINTAIYSRAGGSIGIGFAIPSNMVARVVAAARGGKLVRPWLGATGQTVTSDIAASLGLKRPRGVLINRIFPGGAAARGGLRVGDIVTAINGREVRDGQELRFRIATLAVGGSATLRILRRGREQALRVALQRPPEDRSRNATLIRGRNPFAGATIANLSPALAEELGVKGGFRGVVLMKVAKGSLARRFRLAPGDVILAVNGKSIGTVRQFRSVLARGAEIWEVIIRRSGRRIRFTLPG